MSNLNPAIAWLCDQLRIQTDQQQEACESFATYVCSMSEEADMDEFLAGIMTEVSQTRRAKIVQELLRRRGMLNNTTKEPNAPSSAPSSALPTAPKTKTITAWTSATKQKPKKGQLLMSNVASRRNIDINGTTSNKNTNPNAS